MKQRLGIGINTFVFNSYWIIRSNLIFYGIIKLIIIKYTILFYSKNLKPYFMEKKQQVLNTKVRLFFRSSSHKVSLKKR